MNITMRINKNGSRSFRIRACINGTTFQRTWPSKTEPPIPAAWSDKRAKTEATKIAALFEEQCRNSLVSTDSRTLSEYAHYVLNYKSTTLALKPSTIAGYQLILNRIDTFPIAKIKLRDLTAKHLNTFYSTLLSPGANLKTGKPLSEKTVHEYHAFLAAVLHEAVREQVIPNNPTQFASPPKIKQKEPNYFTPEQMTAIIDAVNQESLIWQAMTYIFIATGARRGEVLALKWSDIDYENNRIFIRRNITRSENGGTVVVTPKSNHWRIVSVSPAFLAPVKKWQEYQSATFPTSNEDSYCFALDSPNKYILPDTITRYYARFAKKYNLPHINPHAFRHSQASIILQSGDIVAASKRLGHAKASTTMNIYGHMLPTADREAANRVQQAFLSSGNTHAVDANTNEGEKTHENQLPEIDP